MTHTKLTPAQKLSALAFKYYQGDKWEPKTGDYYTTSRDDLQLYQIVEANEKVVKTKYYDPQYGDTISEWLSERFLLDFGINRVWVPDWVLKSQSHPHPQQVVSEEEIEQGASDYLAKSYSYVHHDFRKMIYAEWKAAIKWYKGKLSGIRWTEIKEGCKLPDYDHPVLWLCEDGNMHVESLDKDGNPWLFGEGEDEWTYPGGKATHWMELPSTPTPEENK